LKNTLQVWCRLVPIFVAALSCSSGLAQTRGTPQGTLLAAAIFEDDMPDAPQAQQAPQTFAPAARQMEIAPIPPARRYAQVIEPGQTAYHFTHTAKLVFSFTEVARPITLLPALYSASYEQLFNTDPKYGHDSGAFGEKFGASMLRSASVRVFSDGILAGAFHQDPRYYRIAHGSIVHRGLLSARQAVIRRGDNGSNQFNFSGIGGRAAAAALVVTYYPEPSITAKVVANTFWTSIATDAGGNLLLEFVPSLVHKFPIMKKLRLE
jgi:hypothetical protein